jgi:hypothetical protein
MSNWFLIWKNNKNYEQFEEYFIGGLTKKPSLEYKVIININSNYEKSKKKIECKKSLLIFQVIVY